MGPAGEPPEQLPSRHCLGREEKESIRSIKRKRLEAKQLSNSSLLIKKLPNELFVEIFHHYYEAVRIPGKQGRFWLGARYSNWSHNWHGHLMLVCRHWRNIIVSTPAFWGQIDLERHASWTKLCLSRSAAAPIDVRADYRHTFPLELVFPHACRLRTFYSKAARKTLVTALPSFFGGGMPFLEDLHLDVLERVPRDDMDVHLASQRFPRLRTLALSAMVAPRDTLIYGQLRTLSLSRCSYDHSSTSCFLDALASCPQLEELTLKNTLRHLLGEWTHSGPVPHRPLISLPHLRRFTSDESDLLYTSRFLAHLHLQASVVLDISVMGIVSMPRTPTMTALLPPDRSTTLPGLATATAIRMMICDSEYQVEGVYDDPNSTESRRPGEQQHILLTLSAEPDNPSWDPCLGQGLADLMDCFGQSPLTSLVVRGDHNYGTVPVWEAVFRTFPLLEKLDITSGTGLYDDISAVFLALHAVSIGAGTAHTDSDSACAPLACPNLKKVCAQGLGTVRTYEAMVECFRYRGERGAALQLLCLELGDGEGVTPALRRAYMQSLLNAEDGLHSGDTSEESDGE